MPEEEKPDLMLRLGQLVKLKSRRWTEIAKILNEEGYRRKDGNPLTPETIRKRWGRWGKTQNSPHEAARRETKRTLDEHCEKKTEQEPDSTAADNTVSAKEMLSLITSSMERRDSIILEQIKSQQTLPDISGMFQQLQISLEQKFADKRDEHFVEAVEHLVGEVLKEQMAPGGTLRKEISNALTELKDGLPSIITDIIADQPTRPPDLSAMLHHLQTKHEHKAGPGRGHKSTEKSARFSATIDPELYQEMKTLGGVFSQHMEAACRLYLEVLRSQGGQE